ncbi:topoisomerase-4 subunit A [Atopostipes suicloacalis DSM 15692]|uniref:DNA topoisomerase 4 subunit A n=1 Tax=Atopostipes suicloacalis DSM 15692 TaxID=1121025 RepID=A0A1M4WEW1_9LACT|nr:DNA topoisomerase IV subunit A [Atopostipes suicloacalis]SHE79789.1 topoisomerase-4 subunit A [Atopostipes suicloacalis DSM 15692]
MAESSGIQKITLENVMGDRFGRYSKYIIQERAIPDIRDGLKPVQRRIIFAMQEENNTHDKAYRKSAKTVGNVIGNYHPHGDTSVYDAMVRLSQEWKMLEPLVDMQGNNGSMDGDPAAAMRYTEARLSKIANELVKDINLDTVDFILNFDDTDEEPTVLPAKYPNLLVNGATGISAGYATDIPPHNLGEIIDATVHLIDHPEAHLKTLMKYVKGPDFPTGGIVQGAKGLKKAFDTGRGRIVIRSKTEIEKMRGGREQIVITEIPYDVNKSSLVSKIHDIRINKKIDGIADVRDETDRAGLRIVVELRKSVNAEGVLTYLLKNTDLQISYNYNVIAIDDKQPKQLGLRDILNSYLNFRREVVTRRTNTLLKKDTEREHIVKGLIKAISILDKVITTIRESKNKSHAKVNLINDFEFSERQAEAIVNLQLYRLTNTDITELEKEAKDLETRIKEYNEILNNKEKLDQVIKKELKDIKKNYATPRLTQIEDEIEELKVEKEVLISEEEVIVTLTREGYLKRTSLRSYQSSSPDDISIRNGDHVLFAEKLSTLDQMIIFTSKGKVINRPIHELPDIRWKDPGQHLSQSISFEPSERIVVAYSYRKLPKEDTFVLITRNGNIKQTKISDFAPKRSYKTQSFTAIRLEDKSDELVNVYEANHETTYDVFLVSHRGYGLRYSLAEVSTYGTNAKGVRSMNLKDGDYVISGCIFEPTEKSVQVMLVTHRGAVKKMNVIDFDIISRAKRGLLILRELKANPHRVALMFSVMSNDEKITLVTNKDHEFTIQPKDYGISDRYSNGSFVLDEETDGHPVSYRRDDLIYEKTEETDNN